MTTTVTAPTGAPVSAPTRPRPVAPPQSKSNDTAPSPSGKVQFSPIGRAGGHRLGIYGPGGIGKTTLACIAPGPVAFFDLDESLPRLKPQLDELSLDLRTIDSPTWATMRAALASPGWDDVKTIVIDSGTKAEELCVQHVIENVPHETGKAVKRIEDYGYGKGYTHVYDVFITLLGDLDRHARKGRNVVLLCHECTATVPNPNGEDWIRYEPRLQSPASGKSSIRHRLKEWADHLLFIGYDVDVKEGVGKGRGTRSIYPFEQPQCMAKSRTISNVMVYNRFDSTIWAEILK